MTRINCIPVEQLSSQHLVAEYREMLRLRHAYPRRFPPIIPSTYRMGTGHQTFFYDKGLFLEGRHRRLREEMIKRGFTVNFELDLSHWPKEAMNDWNPPEEAQKISLDRLIERDPDFYLLSS